MQKINRYIKKITATLVVVISIIGATNAILRYSGKYLQINLSSNLLLELQWYFFSIIFLLGASYTFSKDKHIRVDVFYNSFNLKKKKIFNILATIILLIPFSLTLMYLSWGYFYNSVSILEQSSEPNGLPRYIIKFFMPLSFFILFLNAVKYCFQQIKDL